jgi:hypothetical protein
MTSTKSKRPIVLIIVAAVAAYLYAHPPVSPKPATVTLVQGTAVEVRLDQTVSSKTSASGSHFSGKLAKPLVLDGKIVVPEGTEFSRNVIQAVPAGHLAGGASLRIALTSFALNGHPYTLQTVPIVRVSQGRGKRTAEITAGGAVLGAAIGALAHGGKGALIGAAAGAGAGAVGSAATNHPVDIVMPAESVLTFHLIQAVVITPKPAPQPPRTDVAAVLRGLFP